MTELSARAGNLTTGNAADDTSDAANTMAHPQAHISTKATAASPPDLRVPAISIILVVAVAAGARAQGAFYPVGRLLVGGLVVAACIVSVIQHLRVSTRTSRVPSRVSLVTAPVILTAALTAWTIVSAVLSHHWVRGLAPVALLLSVCGVAIVVRRLPRGDQLWLVDGLIAVGVAVALCGWAGVALHLHTFAHVDQHLWRAFTTITYANASAGVLAPLAIMAVARLAATGPGGAFRPVTLRALATVLLILGTFTTLSRAGIIAMILGMLVLAVTGRGTALLQAMTVTALGTVICAAGLVTSIPDTSGTHPATALVSLVLGSAIAVAGYSRAASLRALTIGISALIAVATIAALALSRIGTIGNAVSAIARPRLSLQSGDRGHEWSSAWHAAITHPWFGVGPGSGLLQWHVSSDSVMVDQFAHNEYLQVAWKGGFVALLLLIALAAWTCQRIAATRPVENAREGVDAYLWQAVVGALAALVVGSAFDFLWHTAIIPLIGAVLIGVGLTNKEART